MKILKLLLITSMLGIANASTDEALIKYEETEQKLKDALSSIKPGDVNLTAKKLDQYKNRVAQEISDENFRNELMHDPKSALKLMLSQIFINSQNPNKRGKSQQIMELFFQAFNEAIDDHAKKFSATLEKNSDKSENNEEESKS